MPREKFEFVPYCVRHDALDHTKELLGSKSAEVYVLAAGRNRDLWTFIRAMTATGIRAVVVGGKSDRNKVPAKLPDNVNTYFEIPFHQYRDLISNAHILVIPLRKDHMHRSLGQVAAFEAIAKGVPVIAARTFQLADYFASEKEVLYYEPENAGDLRSKILRLMDDSQLRDSLTKCAYDRMMSQYTDIHYTDALLRLCRTTYLTKVGCGT